MRALRTLANAEAEDDDDDDDDDDAVKCWNVHPLPSI